jgi:hypothetical protein
MSLAGRKSTVRPSRSRHRLAQVDQSGDVLGDGGGQAPRYRVPVALHEHERDDRLQNHHRGDDDEKGADVEPLRQHALDPAVEALEAFDQPARCRPQPRDADVEARHVSTSSR